MIREVIRPQHTSLTIDIPTDFIDKDVELILFTLDEKPKAKNKKSLKGVFNKYADKSKQLQENSAWKKHLEAKYS